MRAIAVGTIHGKRVTRARDPKVPHDRGEIEDVVIAPKGEFDTKDLGMSDKEAAALFRSGAAMRKTRQVADDGPAPSGGFAGAGAPDPNAVADRSMAGENLFSPPPEPKLDFEAMTVAELKEYAEAHGIDVTGLRAKAELVEALNRG